MKCASETQAIAAMAGTSSGSAYARSIASRARRRRRFRSSASRVTVERYAIGQFDLADALPGAPATAAERLQPAAPPEEDRQADQHEAHQRDDDPERERLVLAGHRHVHPVDRRDQGQRQED